MISEASYWSTFGFALGLGLLIVGALFITLPRAASWVRLAISAVVVLTISTGTWAILNEPLACRSVALILGIAILFFTLATSDRFVARLSSVLHIARRPAVLGSILVVAGLGIATTTPFINEERFNDELDRQMAAYELLAAPPPTQTPSVRVTTDRGTPVTVAEAIALRTPADMTIIENTVLQGVYNENIIRVEPATDRTNCHGWVFTGGRYWVSGSEVPHILADNNYQVVEDPHPGDLAVYRLGNNIAHVAIVRYVADGQPVLVEGKWGCSGVYLHAVDKSIYGKEYKFYRAPRSSHLLAGIESPPVAPPTASPNPANMNDFAE
jgi:hypothetical protein